MKGPVTKAKERPAETSGGVGGAIAVLGAAIGLDPEVVAAIAVTAAFIPALVTYIVDLRRSLDGGP